jgi:hypothetical protein
MNPEEGCHPNHDPELWQKLKTQNQEKVSPGFFKVGAEEIEPLSWLCQHISAPNRGED